MKNNTKTEKDRKKRICPILGLQGNVLVESVPVPKLDDLQLNEDYTVDLKDYFRKDLSMYSREERRLQLSELSKLRICLPFQKDMEMEFYRTIVESYSVRYLSPASAFDDSLRLCADPSEGTSNGFCLLGCSGTGKTSSIRMMLKHYDQIRTISDDKGNTLTRILYIFVNCKANSNFNALYSEIGKQIDKALNTGKLYQNSIDRCRTLADKLMAVEELIETFAIGIIIFDEIQLIDFSLSKENSFQSLMILANETKVGMCFIGTEDAYDNMFSMLRNARRAGKVITSNDYIADREFFSCIMNSLFNYQWFDKPQKITNEIIDAFYEETHGIICLAVVLYKYVIDDYLIARKHFDISPEFIHVTFAKYFGRIKEKLQSIDMTGYNRYLEKTLKEVDRQRELMIERERQQVQARKLISTSKQHNNLLLIDGAQSMILTLHDEFDPETIRQNCEEVLTINPDLNTNDLAKFVIKRLEKPVKSGKAKTRSKVRKQELANRLNLE